MSFAAGSTLASSSALPTFLGASGPNTNCFPMPNISKSAGAIRKATVIPGLRPSWCGRWLLPRAACCSSTPSAARPPMNTPESPGKSSGSIFPNPDLPEYASLFKTHTFWTHPANRFISIAHIPTRCSSGQPVIIPPSTIVTTGLPKRCAQPVIRPPRVFPFFPSL